MSRQTITEFLEARIAEDEEEAEHFLERYRQGEDISKRRWLRILREAEAKQAIIALAQQATQVEKEYEDYEWQGTVERDEPYAGDAILLAIAAVYKYHPDYRQEWVL